MTYYCRNCNAIWPIDTLSIVQDASVSFGVVYTGGRWHREPIEADNVGLYDEINYYCGECMEEVDEPDTNEDFWAFTDEIRAKYDDNGKG